MIAWIKAKFFPVKPKRLELRFTSYAEADRLIREEGWQLAIPEEDRNFVMGMVYIERVEKIP